MMGPTDGGDIDTLGRPLFEICASSWIANPWPSVELDRIEKRKTARESFRAFVNPKSGPNADLYSHPAGRRLRVIAKYYCDDR